MPVIAAILFEFTLRELQLRAGRADRRLAALRWLHPAERVRVQLRLAADDHVSARPPPAASGSTSPPGGCTSCAGRCTHRAGQPAPGGWPPGVPGWPSAAPTPR